ncbi:hypothetical protein [uncultured Nocardioides sp.]|uniref:hypothetical protein n=1 Tax=uncultured Nocardioides sp. TaxID=198441 RepID=UPI0026016064|nr:hypothetical protein [uncultured Nocardioides sp.]
MSTYLVRTAAPDVLRPGRKVEPTVVPVQANDRTETIGVGVTVEQNPGLALSSNASGRLTSMRLRAGDRVQSGHVVARINDVSVVAMESAAPLYRDLASGDTGRDVARLQGFLRVLNLLAEKEISGSYDASTAVAIGRFKRRYGISGDASTFPLASVVWVGPRGIRVARVEARPNSVVATGTVLATGMREAIAIAVSEPAGGIADTPGGHLLQVAGSQAPYRRGSGLITQQRSVSRIAAVLGTSGEGVGQVVTRRPTRVLTLPASAVVTTEAGSMCVYTSASSQPILVEPLGGGSAGTVDVPEATQIDAVLVNPLQVIEEPECR